MATKLWQCNKCGDQRHQPNPPGPSACKMGGNHVWASLGRFIKHLFEF